MAQDLFDKMGGETGGSILDLLKQTQQAGQAGVSAGMARQDAQTSKFLEMSQNVFKMRYDTEQPFIADKEGNERELTQRELLGSMMGVPPEGLTWKQRVVQETPYQTSLRKHREASLSFKERALAAKIPREITLAMTAGSRFLSLAKTYEESDPERADLNRAKAEENITRANELINEKFGSKIPQVIMEEKPMFEAFGFSLGTKKVITTKPPKGKKQGGQIITAPDGLEIEITD